MPLNGLKLKWTGMGKFSSVQFNHSEITIKIDDKICWWASRKNKLERMKKGIKTGCLRCKSQITTNFKVNGWWPQKRTLVTFLKIWFSSVEFSRSVMSNSLGPHELQHARPPCPSPTPRVYSNSCPLSRWCHPTISSFVIPFSSCLKSFPASGSFQMSQLFVSDGQILEFQLQHQSFQWLFRIAFL